MTITVYIWLPKLSAKLVGHASMALTNDTYISWWPEGGKGKNPKPSGTPIRTLEQDIEDEAGSPDYTIKIPRGVELDEDAIQSWWDEIRHEGHWTLITNCCWMVEEALKKGGIEKYLKIGKIKFNFPQQLLALMREIQAIRVSTGRPLEVSSGSLSDDDLELIIQGLLIGEVDTHDMNLVLFS